MLFNSISFAIFLPVVYGVYRRLPYRRQNVLLLVASYVFYGSWDWRFLSLILLSTVVDYWIALRIHEAGTVVRRKRLLALSLITNLGLLGTFKYLGFFSESFAELMNAFGISVSPVALDIVLPVGISFYTFQTLSYTIDVYRGKLEPERRFLDFALFVAFFPQLVAGPIERARRMLPQIRHPRPVTERDVSIGLWYMLLGYCLKVFVADNLAPIADAGFSGEGVTSGITALLGVYAFAFQIFGDFAGYSWIAIGVARLMGFRLTTNFLAPYLVTDPQQFWRNWHISLSTWLRDYLYIPLGGNRGGRGRTYRNLALTMILGGLWHGAAWTFVAWGVFHGALLIGHRLLVERRPVTIHRRNGWAATALKLLVMFHITCFGWLVFRADDLNQIGAMSMAMTRLVRPTQWEVTAALELVFFASLALGFQALVVWRRGRTDLGGLPLPLRIGIPAVMFWATLIWGSFGGSPFIYFQF